MMSGPCATVVPMSNTETVPTHLRNQYLACTSGYRYIVQVIDRTTNVQIRNRDNDVVAEVGFPRNAIVHFTYTHGTFNIVDPDMGYGDEQFVLGETATGFDIVVGAEDPR